ncbi:MAG: hypothetical protein HY318_08930 [Armatimonadetes bacterium]|nr:hypothetical protein [Armatimonadota bacterium]
METEQGVSSIAKTIAPKRASAKELKHKLVKPRKKASPDAAQAPTAAVEGKTISEAEEVPEVLNLHPLSRKRVTIQVRERGPAPFRFVDEPEDVTDPDIPEVFHVAPARRTRVTYQVRNRQCGTTRFVEEN